MERMVYYSKVSLDSQEVYDLLDNDEIKFQITRNILKMISHDFSFQDTYTYKTEDGEQKEGVIDYSLSIEKKDDESIEGVLYRKSVLFIKERDKNTGEMVPRPVENTEDVLFYYDVLHEYVAFIVRKRFGKNMFNEAFAKLLNKCSEAYKYSYSFYVESFNAGLTINEIKELIKNDKQIKELTITYRPANPDDGIITAAREAREKEKLRESNATERSVIYKAKGNDNINGSAEIINDDLNFILRINEDIPIIDMTQRGYVVITSKNGKGDVKTTTDTKPFVKVINDLTDFVTVAKKGITEILRKAANFD